MRAITITNFEFTKTRFPGHLSVKIHYLDGTYDKSINLGFKETKDGNIVLKQPTDTNGAKWTSDIIDIFASQATGEYLVDFGMGVYEGKPVRRCVTAIKAVETSSSIDESDDPFAD